MAAARPALGRSETPARNHDGKRRISGFVQALHPQKNEDRSRHDPETGVLCCTPSRYPKPPQ